MHSLNKVNTHLLNFNNKIEKKSLKLVPYKHDDIFYSKILKVILFLNLYQSFLVS